MFNPEGAPRWPEKTPQQELNGEAGEKEVQAPASEDIEQETKELEEKFSKKSLGEKLISEYQTRRVPEGQLEKRIERVERGENTRFERGQIYKAYKILRKEIQNAEKKGEDSVPKKGLLKEIRGRAKEMQRDLDELEHQLEDNVRVMEVETEFGKFSIPVTELDLQKELKPGEKDDRVPYVFWGGIRSTAKMNGCAVMALALVGQKVYVPMHLEQEAVEKPENLKKILRQRGSFEPHAKITRGIIDSLGLKRCNIVGYSAGAGIALETAIELSNDPGSKGLLNDLIVIEPLGLDEKGVAGLAIDFGIDAATKVVPSSEARIKVMRQGGETNKEDQKLDWETVHIMAKKQFTAERLSEIETSGSFQWWVGRSSTVTNLPLTERVIKKVHGLRQEKESNTSLPELNEVVGGTHSLLNMNALGLAEMFIEKRQDNPSVEPRVIKRKNLANSAMMCILEDIKNNR